MQITKHQIPALSVALSALQDGDSRAFEDVLWLGLGDQWTSLRDRLIEHGYIAHDRRSGVYALARRGDTLLARIKSCADSN